MTTLSISESFYDVINQLQINRIIRLFISLVVVWTPPGVAQTHLNVWYASPDLTFALVPLVSQFETAHPDVKISLLQLPNEELKTSVIKAVSKDNAPDMIILPSDNLGLAKVMELSELAPSIVSKGINENAAKALKMDGKVYGLPLYQHNRLMMFYNKKIVQQPARTWEELEQQHQGFAQRGVQTLAINTMEPFWFAHFVAQVNPDMFNASIYDLNSEGTREALQFFNHLISEEVTSKDCTYDCVTVDFYNGKFAYAINGNWSLRETIESLGPDIGIAPFPSYRGKRARTMTAMAVLAFPNNSYFGEKNREIKQLTEYLRSPDIQKALFEISYLMPYDSAVINELSDHPWMKPQIQVQSENMYVSPSTSVVSLWNGMQKGLSLYFNNQLDAPSTTEYMQKVLLRDVQNLKQAIDEHGGKQ